MSRARLEQMLRHSDSEIDDVFGRLTQLVGTELFREDISLSHSDIRKYCIATGVSRPEHVDRKAALAAGFADVTAPPSIFGALTMTKLHDRDQLQEDGVSAYLPLGNLGSVIAETELQFHELALAGEPIVMRRTITDVQMKKGRTGRMIFSWHEARFTGLAGNLKAVFSFVQVCR